VSVDIGHGELIGLIGPNGAGKSTLLSLIAGLSTPSEGDVFIGSQPIHDINIEDRARRIGWLEQIGEIHWPLTVHRLVALGRFPHQQAWQKITEEDKQAIDNALTITDAFHLAERDVTTLSGGERARVLMARVLAAEPEILLADEPVSALDLGHQLQTMDVLRRFANKEKSCVVVLHDLSLAARYCDRLYLLNNGKVHASGSVATVLSEENISDVYGVSVIRGQDDIPWIVPHSLT